MSDLRQRRLTARVGAFGSGFRSGELTYLRKPLPGQPGTAQIPPMIHTLPSVAPTFQAESLPAPTKRNKEEVQLHTITQRLAPPAPEPLPILKVESPYPPPLPAESTTIMDPKYNKAIMFVVAGLVLAGAAYFGVDIAVVFESLMRLIGAY